MSTTRLSWHMSFELEKVLADRRGKLKIVMIIGGMIAGVLAVVLVSLAVVSSRSRYEAEKRVFQTKKKLSQKLLDYYNHLLKELLQLFKINLTRKKEQNNTYALNKLYFYKTF